ncbi:glycosyl hydrolase [Paenibacillus sacheonensis]|uniref:Beta-mannosidase n=1 Tax=Paenibacillus sacheonensis TaxID=742054 RepID=A0A7X5BVJ8_9BACL|nr:glycosyl hydrolase [Paenibacillus sacheonensis]MBM7568714.1 mannan endo-1,4-beta-mannosidase [Paenibacillus sacheonensis]NBC68448.1 beta-mannosidase [Paenibacillus sacheonensis]
MNDWSQRMKVEPKLINPQADDCARRLMAYLCDAYGKRMLTGQQIGVHATPEMDVIQRETGHYPAVGGFDFMNDSPSRTERGSVGTDTALALQWWRAGGIVTFCWHWNAPKDLVDQPPDNGWHRGFYTTATTFDIANAMDDPSSEEYALLLRDIDAISGLLAQLREAGVPVLWRPLHEASGGWFWWGAKGPEPCIRLWKLMYDRMTRLHGLHNLIWVWNGQHKDWYPGDAYVDIIGEDVYSPARNYQSNVDRFRQALSYTNAAKIIALSENGPLPDPDRMIEDGALWLWNCTWYGNFVHKQEERETVVSDQYTEREMLKKVYRHPFTVTRDELPDLIRYPLHHP